MALQLTNILRDIREDHRNGRVYLPAEDLASSTSTCDAAHGRRRPVQPLIEFEAERARDWYASGWRCCRMLDRRSAACTGAMAGIYRRLLERIARAARRASWQPGVAAAAGERPGRRAAPWPEAGVGWRPP